MTNPIKGEVLVPVSAGEFTLVFTLGAMAAMQSHFGSVEATQKKLEELQGDSPDVTTVAVVIWAGLKKHHGLTLDEVFDLVSIAEMPIWGEKLTEAFALSNPAPSAKENPRKAGRAGTGRRS